MKEQVPARSMNAARLFDQAFVEGYQLGYNAAYSFVDRGHIYLASPKQGVWADIHVWCKAQFGKGNYSWAGNTFAFRTPEEATLFKLRW